MPSGYSAGAVAFGGLAWSVTGPAHKRRHLSLTADTAGSPSRKRLREDGKEDPRIALGAVLNDIKSSLLTSPAFARYLEVLTSLRPTGYRDEIRRFRPGLDYTVAHMGNMSKEPRLE